MARKTLGVVLVIATVFPTQIEGTRDCKQDYKRIINVWEDFKRKRKETKRYARWIYLVASGKRQGIPKDFTNNDWNLIVKYEAPRKLEYLEYSWRDYKQQCIEFVQKINPKDYGNFDLNREIEKCEKDQPRKFYGSTGRLFGWNPTENEWEKIKRWIALEGLGYEIKPGSSADFGGKQTTKFLLPETTKQKIRRRERLEREELERERLERERLERRNRKRLQRTRDAHVYSSSAHVYSSRHDDEINDARHPYDPETRPYDSGDEQEAKSPFDSKGRRRLQYDDDDPPSSPADSSGEQSNRTYTESSQRLQYDVDDNRQKILQEWLESSGELSDAEYYSYGHDDDQLDLHELDELTNNNAYNDNGYGYGGRRLEYGDSDSSGKQSNNDDGYDDNGYGDYTESSQRLQYDVDGNRQKILQKWLAECEEMEEEKRKTIIMWVVEVVVLVLVGGGVACLVVFGRRRAKRRDAAKIKRVQEQSYAQELNILHRNVEGHADEKDNYVGKDIIGQDDEVEPRHGFDAGWSDGQGTGSVVQQKGKVIIGQEDEEDEDSHGQEDEEDEEDEDGHGPDASEMV